MSTVGSTPPPASTSRLCGIAVAQHNGYNGEALQTVINKIASVERHLSGLLGPAFESVRVTSVAFTQGKKGMVEYEAPIAISNKELIIDPSRNSPEALIRKLVFYLPHEYGHALTLDPDILWQGVSEETRKWAARWMRPVREGNFSGLSAHNLLQMFSHSLPEGINNPFVSGLKSGAFRDHEIYESISIESGYEDAVEFIMEQLLFALGEVVANRIAMLTMPYDPANMSIVRDDIQNMVSSSGNELTFTSASSIRVFAEKTGNFDLVRNFNVREFQTLYIEMCQVFSQLWDGIELKRG